MNKTAYLRGFIAKVAQSVKVQGRWYDTAEQGMAAMRKHRQREAMRKRQIQAAKRKRTANRQPQVAQPAPVKSPVKSPDKPVAAQAPRSKAINWDAWRAKQKANPNAALAARQKRIQRFEKSPKAKSTGI